MIDCDPSVGGIILRIVIAAILISYGAVYKNYWVLVIGFIPIFRLSYYFLYKYGYVWFISQKKSFDSYKLVLHFK